MAIYAADIQINVKNKGDLRTLENRFKQINVAAVSLNKTLKGLGRRNAIRVDTRAAMSAISALESRIRGLNRSVNIDARTRESRSGGGASGGVGLPLAAAAFSNNNAMNKGVEAFKRVTNKQMQFVDRRIAQIEAKFNAQIQKPLSPIQRKIQTLQEAKVDIRDKQIPAIFNKKSSQLRVASLQQLKEQIAEGESLSKGLQSDLENRIPKPRNKFERRGLTGQFRKEKVDELRGVNSQIRKLKGFLQEAESAADLPRQQAQKKMSRYAELTREQAGLKAQIDGTKDLTKAREKGNEVSREARTLQEKIDQSRVNRNRIQARGQKLQEELTRATEKQTAAQKDFITKQKQFNTRQAKQKNAVDLEKQLATATQNRAKAQQELTKWESAQQKQIDRYGPNNIRRNFAKPGGAIDKSTKALAEADRKVAEINDKLQKTGKATDWSKPLSRSKKALGEAKAEAEALDKSLIRNNQRFEQGNKILNRRLAIQRRQKFMGAAGRGAAASAALIPGVAPLAVGGFAGAANGGGLAGGAVGVAVAGAVQAAVALGSFVREATIASSEMKKMELALTGVVSSNEDYNKSLKAVEDISKSLKIPQSNVIKSFTRLQASASASGFEVDDVRKMMSGFSKALIATEGDAKNFNGVMLALGQVMGKGKAAAEELRGQIGERLSVVIPELAASMGVTTRELDKLFEQGKVTVQNIVDLGGHLEKKYGQSAANIIKSTMNAGEGLKYSMDQLKLSLGPILIEIGGFFQNLATTIIETLTPAIAKIAELMGVTREGAALKLASLGATEIEQKEQANRVFDKSWIDKDRLKEAAMREDGLEFLRKHQQSRGQARLGISSSDLAAIRSLLKTQEQMKKFEAIINPETFGVKGKKTDGQGVSEEEARRLANFEKFKDNMEIEQEFLKVKLHLGTKQAELEKEIALMVLTHGKDKEDAIRAELTARQDLEDQLKSEVVTRGKINDMIEANDQKLKDLVNPMNQAQAAADAIGTAFADSVREVIKGTKSIGDAVADMLNRIADHFLNTAADLMAQQASNWLFKIIAKSLLGGIGGGSSFSADDAVSAGFMSSGNAAVLADGGFLESTIGFSSGGYVDRPTKGLIGEGGEGEYVIKESQMAGAMARWSQGNRGKSVIHGSDGGVGSNQAGGSTEIVVNYTGPSLVFNEQEYVPKSAVPEIINSAAKRGAEAGQSKVLSQLKNSRSQRARIGL